MSALPLLAPPRAPSPRLEALERRPSVGDGVRFLRSTVDRAQTGQALRINLCAPVGAAVDALWGLDTRRTFLWEAPGQSAIAGVGCFDEVVAHSPHAWSTLRPKAARVLSTVSERTQPGLQCGPARWFGGLAFSAGNWTAFPAAAFVLPRWAYDADAGVLSLMVRAGERSARELAAEYTDLVTRLTEHTPRRASVHVHRQLGPSPAWRSAINAALTEIDAGRLDKVVLARAVEVHARQAFDIPTTWQNLASDDPWTTRFCFGRDGETFVGATPELLVRKTGRFVHSEALAGTAPRNRAGALLDSAKDLAEHRIVVEHIVARLGEVCGPVSHLRHPTLRRLRQLVHLQTPIDATLIANRHVLDVARFLHPTPAVGGTPFDAAHAFINAHEGLDRGWYAGAIGWFDANGDGELRVALRSALVTCKQARLFVGGGIVRGSQVEAELAETELKAQSMLRALGVS